MVNFKERSNEIQINLFGNFISLRKRIPENIKYPFNENKIGTFQILKYSTCTPDTINISNLSKICRISYNFIKIWFIRSFVKSSWSTIIDLRAHESYNSNQTSFCLPHFRFFTLKNVAMRTYLRQYFLCK